MGRNTWSYLGCTVAPERMKESTLVACAHQANRYLRLVWRITFPDGTWARVGDKAMARQYIDLQIDKHK
jgi:hypothetical protein